MPTSTFKRITAWFRLTPRSTVEGGRNNTGTDDYDLTPQLPSGYTLLGFKPCNQFWDPEKRQWVELYHVPQVEHLPMTNRIIAYNRKNSQNTHMSHIWVEVRDQSLFELLQPYFQGFGGFTGVANGIDGRHIYMQRTALKELIPQPAELRVLPGTYKAIYLDLHQLLEYIEQEFADATLELGYIERQEDPQIKWDLLWALFTPGQLFETTDSVSGLTMAFKPKTWVYSDPGQFEVEGEFLEWTGKRYVPTRIVRKIPIYTGTKSMLTLDFKPLTLVRQAGFMGSINHSAVSFHKLAGVYHLNYESFITQVGHSIAVGRDSSGVTYRERAHGRVMIDMMSYRRFNPSHDKWGSDDSTAQPAEEGSDPNGLGLDEDNLDLCLLPPTVYGWSFTLEKWGQFSIDKLAPISFEPDAFTHLVLPEEQKTLIQALIEVQTRAEETSPFGDVIPGKGRGLVILLHGNTGTGKTLTAEAISEYLQLPLYKMSASGMGESSLKQVLELSFLWKAVVLIDEADDLLNARSEEYHGSLVTGTFLRLLEYHSGVLILTTNYVRKIDTAIRSRINLALKFNDPGPEARRMLWIKFLTLAHARIERSEEPDSEYDISQADLEVLMEIKTNGRTIKNLVQTAQALASLARVPLKLSHIQSVWGVQEAFEADME